MYSHGKVQTKLKFNDLHAYAGALLLLYLQCQVHIVRLVMT